MRGRCRVLTALPASDARNLCGRAKSRNAQLDNRRCIAPHSVSDWKQSGWLAVSFGLESPFTIRTPMPHADSPATSYRFGLFEVDSRTGELRKQGRQLKLRGRPFDILLLLLARGGDVITRDELRHQLWQADTFVDFDHGLNSAINRLREALGDSAENPRFIETLPKRGYRFIAPIEVPSASPPSAVVALPPPMPSLSPSPSPSPSPAQG